MPKPFKCGVCGKKFSDKYNLSSHVSVHSEDTPFACPQCPYRGKTKKYLARHTKQIHKEKTRENQCNVCGKFFLHPSSLKVHAMVHSGEKPHSCKVCGKTFRVTYSLNSHMLIHKNEKPFQCSFCDYACRDNSTLRKHQNKHMGLEKIYECKICNKGYKSRAALKIHIGETHLNVDMKKFPCSHCDRVFKSNAHRNLHIKSVHDRALVCNCPICGRRLMNRHNLAAHMRTHLDDRPFSCVHPGCKLSFKDKNSLTKHTVIHDPKLYFACQYCGRKFARKAHAKSHERVMHVERRRGVECDYCGSKFYSKNYLIKHIQTKHVHKQKFKYICDKCGLVTHNKPSIVMHLKYGHANDHDMQCKICDNKIVYKRHIYLKLHYWKTHNIRYKITRKNTRLIKEEREKSAVEIKVEPIEADSYEEIQLMDVHKLETEDDANDESIDYSRRVLSEDIAESVLLNRAHTKEVDFDEFFIRHVFTKQENKEEEEDKNQGVNVEQNEKVKQQIKKILIRTQKLEKAKALREKRKKEEIEKRKRDIEEANLRAERERVELVELRRVREMYNEKMKAALARERAKKEQVKIKYFKKNLKDLYKSNETADKNLEKVQSIAQEDPIVIGDIIESQIIDDSIEDHSENHNIDLQDEDEPRHSGNDDIEDSNGRKNDTCDDSIEDHSENRYRDIQELTNTNEIEDNSSNRKNDVQGHHTCNDNIEELTENHKSDLQELTNNDEIEDHSSNITNDVQGHTYNDNIENDNTNNDAIEDHSSHSQNDVQGHTCNDNIENSNTNNDTIEEHSSNSTNDVQGHHTCNENIENDYVNNDVIEEHSSNITNDVQGHYTCNDNIENDNVNNDVIEEHSSNITNDVQEHHTCNDNIENDNVNNDFIEEHSSNITNDVQEHHTCNDNIENDNTNNDTIEEHSSNITNDVQEHTCNDNIDDHIDVQELANNDDNTDHNKAVTDTNETTYEDISDQPLLERRVSNRVRSRGKKSRDDKSDGDESWKDSDDEVLGKATKMEFKTFQCYVCFKLYSTKHALVEHCQEHFDICHERTLTKCPICNYVTPKGIATHMKRKHDVTITIPINKLKDMHTNDGSRYCYDVNGTTVQVIPSVNTLNKAASDRIDKERRDKNDKTIAKAKLVKKGNEWIVEKVAIDIKFDEIPELSDKELHKCKITDNDVDRLGQLSTIARKRGLKMMYPCFECDKICQNFSALKLHKRRHEDNPKPFKPRRKKVETKKVKLNKANRTALPRPITNKHKCDAKLMEFFKSNIRGKDVEFWQFLKIYNKMDREKVNDFNDLEERSDFGNHLDYYKDVEDEDSNEDSE